MALIDIVPLNKDGEMPTVEVYAHAGCIDGLSSFMVVKRAIEEHNKNFPHLQANHSVELCHYKGDIPRPKKGSFALFVDFTPPSPEFLADAFDYLIIDHHVSIHEFCKKNYGNKYIYDPDKCGAELAWHTFFPSKELPEILKHVSSRDLWKFTDSHHKRYVNCVHTGLMDQLDLDTDSEIFLEEYFLREMYHKGAPIVEYNSELIYRAAKNSLLIDTASGYKVSLVNSSILQSDIGDKEVDSGNADVCVIWYAVQDKIRCSARSCSKSKLKALDVALKFNGGGHENASGFILNSLNIEELRGIISLM